jgi:ATP-dependent protease ClpP protease subunit
MGFASELTLEIDSPGGEVNPGIAVYDVLAEMQPPPETSGVDLVSGTALLILAAGRRGNRRLRSDTHLSFASVSSERPEADVGSANATLAGLLSRNSGMDAAEAAMRMASSGALTPAEAVALGLADRVDDEFQPLDTRP